MSRANRDDFSQATIRTLELRVATLCSNPACLVLTTGPHTEPDKVARIGVAAHIHAAAPGGPRFNPDMTPEMRSSINNGIWLCQNCATLIDRDPDAYPADLLQKWKMEAEERVRIALAGGRGTHQILATTLQVVPPAPCIDVDLRRQFWGRNHHGFSMKNPTTEINGEKFIDLTGGIPIIHWHLHWHYELLLFNNSREDIFNVAVTFSGPEFTSVSKLDKINQLLALTNIELTAEAEQYVESTSKEADIELAKLYPDYLEGLRMNLTYRDSHSREYEQNFQLVKGNFVRV